MTEEQVDEPKREEGLVSKPSLRKRIHYWFCDRFGVVPLDDFDDLFHMVDELGVLMFRTNKANNTGWKAQHEFNKLVVEKIGLGNRNDDDVYRGVL